MGRGTTQSSEQKRDRGQRCYRKLTQEPPMGWRTVAQKRVMAVEGQKRLDARCMLTLDLLGFHMG